MPMPEQGNLIDVPIETLFNGVKVIARFRVLRHEPQRDLYIMQVVEVYQERPEDENSKES